MNGFGLLVGHLLGDYILQNDWMARNKGNTYGQKPVGEFVANARSHGRYLVEEWEAEKAKYPMGHLACTVHCSLYTLAVWACSFWWMPWWGLMACFLIHWSIDRFRLARTWMVNVSGQRDFATGPMAPWSIIIVDNTFHLLTLFAIGLLAGVN